MVELIGAILGTSMFYGLVCWIFRVKHSKRFIMAGIITWLLCATIYGLTNMEHFYIRFLTGLFMYLIGAAVWTGLAIYFDKTNKNIKWILRYIPITTLIIAVALPFLLFIIYKAYNEEKQTMAQKIVQEEVALIATNTQMLMGEYAGYSALNNDWLFRAMDMSNKNPYNGVYMVEPYAGNPEYFIVSITNVPSADCKKLIEHKWTGSALYKLDSAQYTGAAAIPADCSGTYNIIQIMFD